MYFSDTITLISMTSTFDEIGNTVKQETKKDVFCDIRKVGQNEFFKASTADLKPELQVTVFNDDYFNEKNVIITCPRFHISNKRYSVYRTYSDEEKTELYLTENIGDV